MIKTERKQRQTRGFFSAVFFLLIMIPAVALAGARVLGYTPYALLSGSMSPEYETGDLVYVKKASIEEIKEGDVITFVAGEDLTVVTHRVVGTDQEGSYITKGDANREEDANHVIYENIIGKVKFSLPKLGYLSAYLKSPGGKYIGIGVILILLLGIFMPESKRKEKGITSERI